MMTFDEFRDLALNPPRPACETFFEVIQYDLCDLSGRKRSHYPAFDVTHYRVAICHTLPEAESMMRRAVKEATKTSTSIYCFHIKEYPVGELMEFPWNGYGISWRLYDSCGSFIDRTYCSAFRCGGDDRSAQYRGRPAESFRFKAGDIVEVLNGDTVRLAVAAGDPRSIQWYWKLNEKIKKRKRSIKKSAADGPMTPDDIEPAYFDADDDQIPVIDGPDYATTHDHVLILNIMPLSFPLSKTMRKQYEGYYRAMLRNKKTPPESKPTRPVKQRTALGEDCRKLYQIAESIAQVIEDRWNSDREIWIFAGSDEIGAYSLLTGFLLAKRGYKVNSLLFKTTLQPSALCVEMKKFLSRKKHHALKEISGSFILPEINPRDIFIDSFSDIDILNPFQKDTINSRNLSTNWKQR